jgi:NAD(P)-dependent dehydrogenase (short-subunit alcohol dehydrogenase family)
LGLRDARANIKRLKDSARESSNPPPNPAENLRRSNMSLAGKTVVIIGGSSGMGLATAKAAQSEGAKVVITGRSEERLRSAREELGRSPRTVALDAADEAGTRALFEELGSVDHAFITAATLTFDPKLAADSAAMRSALDTRFWGAYYVAKYAAPKMPADGTITFTTGTAARKPIPGAAVVSASCGAVEALARALAIDLAPIRVNTIAPGLIDTPLHEKMSGKERAAKQIAAMAARLPVKRAGRPEDIAQAVLFLMKNPFATGITLTVDGGNLLI